MIGKNKFKRMLLFLILVCFVVFLSGCATKNVEVKTVSNVRTTHTPTGTTPTPAKTIAPKGTLNNPASVGETVIVNVGGRKLGITVEKAIIGKEAWKIIENANMFNSEPKQGYEYALVKIKFDYIKGEGSIYVSEYDFEAYVNGAGYSPAWVVLPNDKPEFEGVNLLPGGHTSGWIAFEVPKNGTILLAYKYLFEPICFIKIS